MEEFLERQGGRVFGEGGKLEYPKNRQRTGINQPQIHLHEYLST